MPTISPQCFCDCGETRLCLASVGECSSRARLHRAFSGIVSGMSISASMYGHNFGSLLKFVKRMSSYVQASTVFSTYCYSAGLNSCSASCMCCKLHERAYLPSSSPFQMILSLFQRSGVAAIEPVPESSQGLVEMIISLAKAAQRPFTTHSVN